MPLTTPELWLYGISSAILVPLVIYGYVLIATGRGNERFPPLYRAEKHLPLAGNTFLALITVMGLMKLAGHFGWLDAATQQTLSDYFTIPFLIGLVAYFWLGFRAWKKLRADTAGG